MKSRLLFLCFAAICFSVESSDRPVVVVARQAGKRKAGSGKVRGQVKRKKVVANVVANTEKKTVNPFMDFRRGLQSVLNGFRKLQEELCDHRKNLIVAGERFDDLDNAILEQQRQIDQQQRQIDQQQRQIDQQKASIAALQVASQWPYEASHAGGSVARYNQNAQFPPLSFIPPQSGAQNRVQRR